LKALGTTGTRPSSVIPDVMPISAQGLPDVLASNWYAAFAHSNLDGRVGAHSDD